MKDIMGWILYALGMFVVIMLFGAFFGYSALRDFVGENTVLSGAIAVGIIVLTFKLKSKKD